ncbi:MAG: amino acid ABC transporter substrate-binding protein [Deltaproteobacteria bacterium]|nr:amino acid ABC transporter substrate-binding protein [Deltaproteobacteria bacterium]MBW2081867.1 amino acid ABC transporter substrate-binding protein [Deltaproteobacteria bacterium]HDM10424.1 branched-chain amino acid ABC transporter substrate-binding protein [Desulfobacteraceae bacterium]
MKKAGTLFKITTLFTFLGLFVFSSGAHAASKIVIGHPACLSGKYAKAGEQAVGGIKACVNWVNKVYGGVSLGGKKIPLVYKYYDCESKKEAVTSLIARLISSDRVNVVFAPYSSGLTLRGAPVAESRKMLYMDHGGANNKIFRQGFRYVVQTIGPATRYHEGTLDMIKKIDPSAKKVALAYEDSEFAKMVMFGAEVHAKKLGLNVVFKRTYPKGVTDLTPLLSAMKAARPDFVLGGGHFEDGQLFSRQMADLDIDVKALSLIAAATLPAFYEALGSLAEGVMGPSHWEYGVKYSEAEAKKVGLPWIGPSQDEFVALFKKAVGKNIIPDYHAAEAGAQVLAYVLAVEKSNSLNSDKVRVALGDLKFMSFYGGWDVDDTGMQVGHSMVDVQWQAAKRVIVWPEEAQTGKLCYPMPTFKEKAKGKLAVP